MKVSTRIYALLLAVVLIIGALPVTAFAQGSIVSGVAFVDASSLRLRAEANTSSKTLATAARGEVVVIVSRQGDWYKVIYNLQEGYMHSDYLTLKTAENVELGYGEIDGSSVNLRSGAGTSYKSVATASRGEKAYIIGVNDGWYKVIYGTSVCYVRSDYLTLTEIPYENAASKNAPLFFRGGKSTGVEPSADALRGDSGNSGTEKPEEKPVTPEDPTEPVTPDSGSSLSSVRGVKHGIAFVTGSGLRMRAEANTTSKTLASASKGEVVVVVSKHGDWYKVIYNQKTGYMHGDYLSVRTTENAELGYGRVSGSTVNLRSGSRHVEQVRHDRVPR